MIEQLKEAIERLGIKLENNASSPANKKLFTSDDDTQQLMMRNLKYFILL